MSAKTQQPQFVICVSNQGHDDLDVWKVYRLLSDAKADELDCMRVVDESGEDYLYPADCFVSVDFPEAVRERLASVDAD